MKRFQDRRLKVIDVPIADIKPYPSNPREHPEQQIQMAMASILEYGMNAPPTLNADHVVIAGHCRLEAMKRLGYETVQVIVLDHLSPDQERAYRIADNAIFLKGTWSFDVLASELELLTQADVSFDPLVIGFDTAEFDGILAKNGKSDPSEKIDHPDPDGKAVSLPGDMWIFGDDRHRLFCGDARRHEDYERVLRGEMITAVFGDIPYNVPVQGHVSGNGRVRHREFKMASGEMSQEQFANFMDEVFAPQVAFSKPGAVHFQCIDWRSVALMVAAGEKHYERLLNICVWVKPVPSFGSPWRSQHEFVCAFRTAGGKHVNNVQLGKHGRNRSNIWQFAGQAGFSSTRHADLEAHLTVKPTAMVAEAIMDVTHRNDLVFDPFLGSGTTIVAAHQTGRRGAGLEIDPLYVDVAVKRITERTSLSVRHEDGRTFEEVRADREEGK